MADLAVSLAVCVGIVLFCEAARRSAQALFSRGGCGVYLTEVFSTLQLCACSHELKLLGESGRIQLETALTLVYLSTVVHISTFHGALCNPSGALEQLYRGSLSPSASSVLIACQLSAAWLSRYAASYLWSFGLSDLHLAHKALGYECSDPINGSLIAAVAVEMACVFVLQATVMNIGLFKENLRVHVIAAVITILAYAGMPWWTPPSPSFTLQVHCTAGSPSASLYTLFSGQDHHRAGIIWVVDHSQPCSGTVVVLVHSYLTGPSSVVTGPFPQDAAHKTLLAGEFWLVDGSLSSSLATSGPLIRTPLHCSGTDVVLVVCGNITGAVMNPALAFSIQFPCAGHSSLEYTLIFVLGPLLGTASAIAVFEIIPSLLRRESHGKKIHTNNSLDWIGHGLDKFLDVDHISVQTLICQSIGQSGQIWWMPSLAQFRAEFPGDWDFSHCW
ncbi:hypothetical protein NFI96_022785 [Prochilodus magdalenae]|nr:hypothetical protein NFI96_022785 [Prochilodus magdalenae]